MRKVYFMVMWLGGIYGTQAQEGKVGINTEEPQETLDIKGTLRVGELPNSAGKIYGNANATTKNVAFTPTKMVVANASGVLGVQDLPTVPTYSSSTSVLLENNKFVRAALMGDVIANKDNNSTKVVAIQGRNVLENVPGNGQVLKWNGSAWAPANDNITNIYTNDGTLLGNRTVTMGANTLAFSGNNTSFIRNGEAVSIKGTNHSYIGYYKANNTVRNAITGFISANANDFTIKNEVANGKVVLDNQTRITNIPLDNTTNELLVTDSNGDVKKRTLASVKDELQRVSIEKLESNSTKDLSRTLADQLKDTYVIDKNKIILPTCGGDYYGKVVSFYKWGGASGEIEFSALGGTIHNPFNTSGFGANSFPGITYDARTSSIKVNVTTSNISSLGFRTYKFICIEGENKWFLDFAFR